MSPRRKSLTQYADELEQWVAQGWLTGQETFIELQDMATLTELIYQEAASSWEVQAEMLGIKGRFQEGLASRLPPGNPRGSVANYRKQESLDSQVIDFPIHGLRILPRKGNFATEPHDDHIYTKL